MFAWERVLLFGCAIYLSQLRKCIPSSSHVAVLFHIFALVRCHFSEHLVQAIQTGESFFYTNMGDLVRILSDFLRQSE